MSDSMIVLSMIVWFLVLGYLGVPVAFAIMASVIWGAVYTGLELSSMTTQLFNGVNSIPLLAVPFFLLTGELLSSSAITVRIVNLAQTLVGHIRAGLAHVVTTFSIFFAGISGSSTADVAAISRVVLPTMRSEGYRPANSAALIAAASTIANMIPPSIMAVVYGATGGVSITALFLAGVVPGLLVGLGLMVYAYFFGFPSARRTRASTSEMIAALRGGLLPLGVPVIIMGGILAGWFTPTEAGMAAVVYTIVVLVPLMRRGHLRYLHRDFMRAGVVYSLPLMAVAAASAFAYLIAYLQAPQIISGWIQAVAGTNPKLIMFLLVLMLVIAGNFLDAIPAIVIFVPIIKALTELGDINPVQMGVVAVVTLAFGLITPPYGLSLLMASAFAGVPFSRALLTSLPIYLIFFAVISVLVLVPDVALWLPQHIVPEATGCFPAPQGGGFICP
ncbi:MAG: TRAP transporter large permease subunit [Streptosporangiales bacterium]|nr:TRAP transporter large permease subunit [Streptosporangiales bacterium]